MPARIVSGISHSGMMLGGCFPRGCHQRYSAASSFWLGTPKCRVTESWVIGRNAFQVLKVRPKVPMLLIEPGPNRYRAAHAQTKSRDYPVIERN